MTNYSKPIVTVDAGMAEGVYADSGCYSVGAYIHQKPETGRDTYCIQVNGTHAASHTTNHQTLYLTFNEVVSYRDSHGTPIQKDGTTISIQYSYFHNGNDNAGLGNVYVFCEDRTGLQITGCRLVDNDN